MMNDKALWVKWQDALAATYRQILQQLLDILPQLLAALVLLLAGWIIAYLAARAARSLINAMAAIFRKWMPGNLSRRETITASQVTIGGRVIFWLVMLFFIAASASVLGITVFTQLLADIVAYLPKLLMGLLILLAGSWLSSVSKSLTTAAALSAGMMESQLLGRIVQFAVLFTTLAIGAQQLGINIRFLIDLLTVVLGVLLAGFSLAFGLGARQLVANVVAAQQVRKHCHVGDRVKMLGVGGVVVDITKTVVIVDTSEGRALIPADKFQQRMVLLNPQASQAVAE